MAKQDLLKIIPQTARKGIGAIAKRRALRQKRNLKRNLW